MKNAGALKQGAPGNTRGGEPYDQHHLYVYDRTNFKCYSDLEVEQRNGTRGNGNGGLEPRGRGPQRITPPKDQGGKEKKAAEVEWCERTRTWKWLSEERKAEWERENPADERLEKKRQQQRRREAQENETCKWGSGCKIGCTKGHLLCHYYYKHGNCRFGDDCKYEHIETPPRFCGHYMRHRTCWYGDSCKYEHVK